MASVGDPTTCIDDVSPSSNPEAISMFSFNNLEDAITMRCFKRFHVQRSGDVDIVSAFFTKNLAQSWQTMFKKFDSIPKRLEEDYHSIKDDVSLVSVYTTGNVTVKGMLISDEFLTDDICETREYKDYEKEFVRVDVPMIHPQLVESTQGANRTPSATRTPNPAEDVVQKKRKSKQVARESRTPRKSLKEEDLEKIVEGGDKESYASEFANSIFLNDEEDSGIRIEPESHKENLKIVDDDDEEKKDNKKDDDNDDGDNDHDDHALVRNKVTGSLEIRNEQIKTKILPGSIAQMSRRRGQLKNHMKNTFVTNKYFKEKMKEILDILKNLVPELTVAKTNELIKEVVLRLVNAAIIIIEELFKSHMQNTVLNMYPTTSTSIATSTIIDLQHQLYLKMKSNLQDQAADPEQYHNDHSQDDAPPDGEKGAKKQMTNKEKQIK
ncbi:hypothetical protein Tco_0720186 [Tanacetum coccineum]